MLSSRTQKMSRLALSRFTRSSQLNWAEPLGLLALLAGCRVVAGYEVVKVGTGERVGLEGEAPVGPQVVYPQVTRPRGLAGGLAVEEEHVGLHSLGVEHAGGQTQQGVHIALRQQLPPHRFPSAAFEQHVVGHHDGRAPVNLQQRPHVLEEVQLLVAGRGPEIGALHD